MPRLGRFGRQLRSLFFKARVEDEVDAELAFHIAMRARELEAQGHAPAQARRLAAERLGDVEVLRRSMIGLGAARERAASRTEYLEEFRHDVRFALRQLLKAPGFAAVAAGTLALGIAGTTAIFSAVRAVVLRPWPSFAELAAERFASFTLGGGDAPERVLGARVTHGFFAVFGARPVLGRPFLAEEDAPGRPPVVMLGEGLWRRRFAADRGVVGRVLDLNGTGHVVVGVMPATLNPSLAEEQLWVPMGFTPEQRAMHDEHNLLAFGLLAPGVSLDRARADLATGMAELAQRFPDDNRERSATAHALGPFLLGDTSEQLWVLLGAVSLVLLIACGNVANLLQARGAARSQELAIRAAIGAGRGRLVRMLLTENLVLSLIGGGLGVAIAAGLIRVLVAAAPRDAIPRLGETRIDAVVLGVALGVVLVATIVSGLIPALRAARRDLQATLRAGGLGAGTRAARDRLRNGLIAGEVALALTLLAGAGLLVRSAINLQRLPTGLDLDGVTAARVALPTAAYGEPDRVVRSFERLVEALRAHPVVEHAAAVSVSPLTGLGSTNGLVPEGRPAGPESAINSALRLVTSDYFGTVRLPLRRGRPFTDRDVAGGLRVMVVSERLAALAWPGEDPVGKRISCCEGSRDDPRWKTVVGVVGDVRSSGPAIEPEPEFYLPVAQAPAEAWQWNNRTLSLVARSGAATDVVLEAMRAAVRDLDPSLALFDVSTAAELRARTLAPARFHTLLLATLAALGLGLALAGIYSIIAYFVSLRTHEIGVRLALGATAGHILRLMTWQGLRPVLAGLALGTAGAAATTRLLRRSLFGLTATDPATFGAVAVLLGAVALAAILIPARRATRVTPIRALQAP